MRKKKPGKKGLPRETMIKIGTYSYDEYVQLVKSFHGNMAPGLIIGG